MSNPTADEERLADLLLSWEERHERGDAMSAAALCVDCPQLTARLEARIALLHQLAWLTTDPSDEPRPVPTPFQPGAVLAGRYRLDTVIGVGGYGQVWQGFDLELHRPVAVKLPRPGGRRLGAGDDFLAEARKVAALACPGVVPVYDVGRHGGATFIVSELIDGHDLARRLQHGPVPLREVVRAVADAARSLHLAHRQGFVHRDIKPANLLLGRDGRVLVTDFGIAVPAADASATDDLAGTLAYMAPEQLFPDRSRVDARSDVYALGVVLYQAVTGRLPFPHASPATLRHSILNAEPASPRAVDRQVPHYVDQAVMRCLAKSPANRYPTAEALANDLTRWLHRGVAGRLGQSVLRTTQKRWGALLAAGGLLVVMLWVMASQCSRRLEPLIAPRQVETPPTAPDLGDERELFNGRDLTGWSIYSTVGSLRMGRAVQIAGGVLRLSKDEDNGLYRLCTKEKFQDFVLRFEYRLVPGGAESTAGGTVMLRVNDPRALAHLSIQVRLGHNGGGMVLPPDEKPPPHIAPTDLRPPGEWNQLEVRCVGPTVTATLNDRQTGTLENATTAAGFIGLSSQRSDIEFRQISVRRIK